jgi:hypothetical protein
MKSKVLIINIVLILILFKVKGSCYWRSFLVIFCIYISLILIRNNSFVVVVFLSQIIENEMKKEVKKKRKEKENHFKIIKIIQFEHQKIIEI